MSSKLSAPPGKSWKITLRFLVVPFVLPNNLLNLPEYEVIIFCKGHQGIELNQKYQHVRKINKILE